MTISLSFLAVYQNVTPLIVDSLGFLAISEQCVISVHLPHATLCRFELFKSQQVEPDVSHENQLPPCLLRVSVGSDGAAHPLASPLPIAELQTE